MCARNEEDSVSATIQQHLALFKELQTAIKLLQIGCREVQSIDGANDFYHLAILTLANGFERFMKVIVCMRILESTGGYPTKAPWPQGKEGHNLVFLLKKVVEDCFPDDYITQIPAAAADIQYLRTSDRLHEIVGLLSGFGQAARYYNLDLVMGRDPKGESPDDVWARLEMAILQEDPNWEESYQKDTDMSRSFQKINHSIVSSMERLARALSRLFTLGGLGAQARQFSGTVYPFLMLRDDQLGNTRY